MHARRATSVPCVGPLSESELPCASGVRAVRAGPAAAWRAVSSSGDQLTKRLWRRQASEARHCAVNAVGGAGTDGGRGGRELDQVVFKEFRRPGVLGRPALARRHPCRATKGGMQRTLNLHAGNKARTGGAKHTESSRQHGARCGRSGRSLDGRARCGCGCDAVHQSHHVGR